MRRRLLGAPGLLAGGLFTGTVTLFGQALNPGGLQVDATQYNMGVQVVCSQAGHVNAIWFFSPSGAGVLPDTIALWNVAGQSLITSAAASWSGALGSGWVRAPFSSPVAVVAGAAFKAAILKSNATQGFYAAIAHYWDTGPGQNGISSGPLSAPNNAGAAQGQDTFVSSGVLNYPGTAFNASNYGIDVEVAFP